MKSDVSFFSPPVSKVQLYPLFSRNQIARAKKFQKVYKAIMQSKWVDDRYNEELGFSRTILQKTHALILKEKHKRIDLDRIQALLFTQMKSEN